MSTAPNDLLAIYLNDHLAGSSAGLALARRMARNHQGTTAARETADLVHEIEEDRSALLHIMKRLGVRPKKIRNALAATAERAARLKPNGAIISRSPLSSVMELETLRLGVEGKAAGWQALQRVAIRENRLDSAALTQLTDRAHRQSEVLERLRIEAVKIAFKIS